MRAGISWLDFKLGIRMLARYPGMTVVGGLAIAFAIWVGAGTFELIHQVVSPTLRLPNGDRIVGIHLVDAANGQTARQVAHDFTIWRRELRSIRDVGAFQSLERTLVTGDRAESVEVAEISASAFRVAGVRPLIGRTLTDADEAPGAPPVAVIGHEVWQRRFAADPEVLGRTVRLGVGHVTVVGVMPEGFGFPIAHSLWTPFPPGLLDQAPREGPALRVFGRLAPGVPMAQAEAELATLVRRVAADHPGTHAHLRPRVLPHGKSIFNLSGTESLLVGSTNVFIALFLVLVCGNVALLMFARAASRESEMVVRSALGASRGRIVTQLFAEALVLGAVGAALGLACVGYGLRWLFQIIELEILDGAPLPFWFDARVSSATLFYAALLTLLGAAIAGVLPALKVTRGLSHRLREAGTGGGGLRFGGIWTVVIVSQIAATIAFPVTAFYTRRDIQQVREMEVPLPEQEFLTLQLLMDRERGAGADTSTRALQTRFRTSFEALERRLLSEPEVVGVTYGDRLPRMYHPHRMIEVDEGGAAPLNPMFPGGYRVSSSRVDVEYFQVLGAPILSGRGFSSADAQSDQHVIVTRSFVERVLGGRNPIGRRIRYVGIEEGRRFIPEAERGEWFEVVGVVPDLGTAPTGDTKQASIYHAVAPAVAQPMAVAVRLRGDAASFGPRLGSIAASVDPGLRVENLLPMDRLSDAELQFLDFWFRMTMLVSAIAVVLSLAGIYSVMSFTVSRRTREIGIRVALGARPVRVIAAIFRRPLIQVGLGVAAGGLLIGGLIFAASSGNVSVRGALVFGLYLLLMLAVCLLACIAPTRRALGVEPSEALRADA